MDFQRFKKEVILAGKTVIAILPCIFATSYYGAKGSPWGVMVSMVLGVVAAILIVEKWA